MAVSLIQARLIGNDHAVEEAQLEHQRQMARKQMSDEQAAKANRSNQMSVRPPSLPPRPPRGDTLRRRRAHRINPTCSAPKLAGCGATTVTYMTPCRRVEHGRLLMEYKRTRGLRPGVKMPASLNRGPPSSLRRAAEWRPAPALR